MAIAQICYTSQAQMTTYFDNFGGTSEDICTDIITMPDFGKIICGYTLSNDSLVNGNHGGYDAWAIRYSSAGQIIWKHVYGGTLDDRFYAGVYAQDLDQIIFTGYTQSNNGDVSGNHGSNDLWVVKVETTTGMLVKQKCYGGTLSDRGNSVMLDNNSIYLAGYTASVDGDVTYNHGGRDFWVLRLDTAFNLNWQKTYGGTLNEEANKISQSNSGKLSICGFTNSNDGDVSGNHGGKDGWIAFVSTAGILQSSICIGGSGTDELFDIARGIVESDYYVGTSNSFNGNITNPKGGNDIIVAKLNYINLLSLNNYGGTLDDNGASINYAINQLAIFGTTKSNNGNFVTNHLTGTSDMALLITDTLGNAVYSNCYGGTGDDLCYAGTINYLNPFNQYTDADYFLGGRSNSINGDIKKYYGASDLALASVLSAPNRINLLSDMLSACPNSTVDVPYVFVGRFAPGSNTFNMYLSDTSGSFANKTLIGSIAGKSSFEKISCNTPSILSNNYKVRCEMTNLPVISNSASLKTICGKPILNSATAITSTSANISWTNNINSACTPINAQIFYRIKNSALWQKVTTANLNYTLTGLTVNSTYQYKVRNKCAVSPNVFGQFSAIKTFKSLPRLMQGDLETQLNENFEIIQNGDNNFMINHNSEQQFNIAVFDANGRFIKNISNANSGIEISLNELASGLYVINCSTAQYLYSVKIMILK